MDGWLETVLTRIDEANSLDELGQSVTDICRFFGFESYSHIDTGQPERQVPDFVSTASDTWKHTYLDEGFAQHDRALSMARRRTLPFTWTDVPLPPVQRGRKDPGRKVFEAAWDHGYTDGVIFPFHTCDPIGRRRSALTALLWRKRADEFSALYQERKHLLHVAAIYWQLKASEFFWSPQDGDADGLQGSNTLRLTAREADVLGWAARGKTTLMIAEILGLSHETVETYFRNAIRSLSANNRTHAVVIAIRRGLIDF